MSGLDTAYREFSDKNKTPMSEESYKPSSYDLMDAAIEAMDQEENPKSDSKKPVDGYAMLMEAADAISTSRNDTHGSKDNCFRAMAEFLVWYNTNKARCSTDANYYDFDAEDAAAIMIGFKLSRIIAGQSNFKDHWMDIAGYAGCGWDCIAGKNNAN